MTLSNAGTTTQPHMLEHYCSDAIDFRCKNSGSNPTFFYFLLFCCAGSADLFAPQWDDPNGLPGGLATGRRAAFGVNVMAGLGDRMLLEVRKSLMQACTHCFVLRPEGMEC